MDSALPEVADHRRQVAVEQRLANAVQHDTLQVGGLVNDAPEFLVAQIVRAALAAVEGQRAGLAEGVAAVAGLDVERAGSAIEDEWSPS